MPPKRTPKVHARRALPVDDDAFVREDEILDVIPVGRTTWREGVRSGRYPAPVKISARVNGWTVGAIRGVLAAMAAGELSE